MTAAEATLDAQTVAVVICAYSGDRFVQTVEAAESVQAQVPPADELILVVDHNEDLRRRLSERLEGWAVLANEERKGLSGARNTGVSAATSDLIVFLDDDAIAEPLWLSLLTRPCTEASVVGTGGMVAPLWETRKPRWFPPEFLWVVGCSYEGLPTEERPIRNPIGASMCFRRSSLIGAGLFATDVGRLEGIPLGCEETELSIRITRLEPGSRILHVPAAVVRHRVSAGRLRPSYFARRCFAEGISKAVISDLVGASSALASESVYVRQTLMAGVRRRLGRSLRGQPEALGELLAILLGLTATAAGYLAGSGCTRRLSVGILARWS